MSEASIYYGYTREFRKDKEVKIPSGNFAHANGAGQVLKYDNDVLVARLPGHKDLILTTQSALALSMILYRLIKGKHMCSEVEVIDDAITPSGNTGE